MQVHYFQIKSRQTRNCRWLIRAIPHHHYPHSALLAQRPLLKRNQPPIRRKIYLCHQVPHPSGGTSCIESYIVQVCTKACINGPLEPIEKLIQPDKSDVVLSGLVNTLRAASSLSTATGRDLRCPRWRCRKGLVHAVEVPAGHAVAGGKGQFGISMCRNPSAWHDVRCVRQQRAPTTLPQCCRIRIRLALLQKPRENGGWPSFRVLESI